MLPKEAAEEAERRGWRVRYHNGKLHAEIEVSVPNVPYVTRRYVPYELVEVTEGQALKDAFVECVEDMINFMEFDI